MSTSPHTVLLVWFKIAVCESISMVNFFLVMSHEFHNFQIKHLYFSYHLLKVRKSQETSRPNVCMETLMYKLWHKDTIGSISSTHTKDRLTYVCVSRTWRVQLVLWGAAAEERWDREDKPLEQKARPVRRGPDRADVGARRRCAATASSRWLLCDLVETGSSCGQGWVPHAWMGPITGGRAFAWEG